MADDDYEVGYGKPPKHSQFKKGESGFKNRKHKRTASASELFERILNEQVTISEGGRKVRMTRLEVILRQQVTKAMSCDRQSAKLVLEFRPDSTGQGPESVDSTADDFLLAELTRMYVASKEDTGDAAE